MSSEDKHNISAGAQRQAQYKSQNPGKIKLSQMKINVSIMKKKGKI